MQIDMVRTNHLLVYVIVNTTSTHHVHKLIEIDLTITISVTLFHELHDSLRSQGRFNISVVKDRIQLLHRNLPIAIAIKDTECSPTHIFLHVMVLVESRSKEFSVVNFSTTIS